MVLWYYNNYLGIASMLRISTSDQSLCRKALIHKKIVSMYRVTSSQMTNAYMARNTEESEIMALNMHAYSTPTFIPAG